MIRHKFVAVKNDWSDDFFNMLQENNYVDFEYSYSKYVNPGVIYTAKDSDSKGSFLSISSNRGFSTQKWVLGQRRTVKTRTMLALTEAGAKFIICMITEEKL